MVSVKYGGHRFQTDSECKEELSRFLALVASAEESLETLVHAMLGIGRESTHVIYNLLQERAHDAGIKMLLQVS